MAAGTIYTFRDNFRANKALIAAQYSGAQVKVVSDAPDFVIGETNKSKAFLDKFPLGKVPVFEGADGTILFKSNAIAYFLANDQLRGVTVVDAAHVQQWIEFADNEILPSYCTWLFPCLGIMQYNKQNTERAKDDIKTALSVLNTHLLTRTYLVGERITLADISVACYLVELYRLVLDEEFRKPYQNTNRWFTTLINQPQFKAVLGAVNLCQKMAQFDAKKFEELQSVRGGGGKAVAGGGKHDKAGGEKSKTKEKAKEEKPKPEPASAAPTNLNDEEDEELGGENSKDVFAHLPKGTFNMEDFKRVYSNNDTKTVALPYFWDKFDKENYSVWLGTYKYPEELKLVFMSCNLVTGMFQRLDRMRKHAFGSVIVFGEDNKSTLSGLWIWRGQDLAFTLSDDLQTDYESYDWVKLDPNSEETKKKITEYFSWEGDFDGKKFNQGKIFK
jgi:elongation factor 1-gamma